jgi:hypothetical protein
MPAGNKPLLWLFSNVHASDLFVISDKSGDSLGVLPFGNTPKE